VPAIAPDVALRFVSCVYVVSSEREAPRALDVGGMEAATGIPKRTRVATHPFSAIGGYSGKEPFITPFAMIGPVVC